MSLLKDVIGYGAHADRPAAGSEGRLYYETDTSTLFRDSGADWLSISKRPSVKLDWSATTDLLNEYVLTTDTWHDVCPNQDFVVSSGGPEAVLAISVRGQGQAGENTTSAAIATRLVLDAGTGDEQTHNLGAGWKIAGVNTFVNIFDGVDTVYIDGLTAGTHTIKVQVLANAAGVAVYLRAASFPDNESLYIQVVEF